MDEIVTFHKNQLQLKTENSDSLLSNPNQLHNFLHKPTVSLDSINSNSIDGSFYHNLCPLFFAVCLRSIIFLNFVMLLSLAANHFDRSVLSVTDGNDFIVITAHLLYIHLKRTFIMFFLSAYFWIFPFFFTIWCFLLFLYRNRLLLVFLIFTEIGNHPL